MRDQLFLGHGAQIKQSDEVRFVFACQCHIFFQVSKGSHRAQRGIALLVPANKKTGMACVC